MINDQALLHLLGRLEHENVQLRDALAQAKARIEELEKEKEPESGGDRPD